MASAFVNSVATDKISFAQILYTNEIKTQQMKLNHC